MLMMGCLKGFLKYKFLDRIMLDVIRPLVLANSDIEYGKKRLLVASFCFFSIFQTCDSGSFEIASTKRKRLVGTMMVVIQLVVLVEVSIEYPKDKL